MTAYLNPRGHVTGTPGADDFRFETPIDSWVTADGANGVDKLFVDKSTEESSYFRAGDIFNSGFFHGIARTGAYGPTLTLFFFEDVTFIGSAFDDIFEIKAGSESSALLLNIDGGTGTDLLELDFRAMTAGASFIVENGTITSSFGLFTSLEKFRILGGSGNEVFRTGDEADYIHAGTGSDDLRTGGGNDEIYAESGGDYVDMGAGNDFFQGNYSSDTAPLTANLGDTLTVSNGVTVLNAERFSLGMGSGDDLINVTRTGASAIYGGDGYDTLFHSVSMPGSQIFTVTGFSTFLDGGVNDTAFYRMERVVFQGRGADDTFVLSGQFAAGSISFDGGTGTDWLRADFGLLSGATSFIVQPDGAIVTNRGEYAAIEKFTLTGGSAADVLVTQGGQDALNGGGSDDYLDAGAGTDVLGGGQGDDQLYAGAGDDYLYGEIGNDFLDGGSGDDLVNGGPGSDTMLGGVGNDTFVVNDPGDTVGDTQGIDTVQTSLGSYLLADGLENVDATLTISGPGQTVRGNSAANRIIGSMANDVLYARAGNDLVIGNYGLDILNGGGGRDILIGGALSPTNLIVNGSFETQDGTNSAEAFIRAGGAASNGVVARTTSSLFGWQSASDAGIELDTIGTNSFFNTGAGQVAVDLEAAAGENLRLYQDVANIFVGGTFVLSFAAGLPIIDSSSESSSASAALEVYWNGVLVGTVAPTSTAMRQYSFVVTAVYPGTGAGGLNRLEFREVGGGSDGRGTMLDAVSLNEIYSDGPDWVTYDNEVDGGSAGVLINLSDSPAVLNGILIEAGQARDTNGDFDILIGIENAASGHIGPSWILGSDGDNFIMGSNDADVLNGAGGDDFIEGNGGGDRFVGGSGNDIFLVRDVADQVEEDAGGGTDEIRTTLAVYSLFGTNLEKLTSLESGIAHDFRGSAADNFIAGNDRNDTFRMQDGGTDSAHGGNGNDFFLFGATLTSADSVDGGAGTDQVAIQGNYTLTFGAGFVNVESLIPLPGNDVRFGDSGTNFYDYNLTAVDANLSAGQRLTVDANRLRVGEDFTFNGSAETDGNFFLVGGHGVDTFTGGLQSDTFLFGENNQFGASDTVNGGPGGNNDQFALRGNYTVTFGAGQMIGIESIALVSAQDTRFGPLGSVFSYNLTMHDDNVVAGQLFTIDGGNLRSGEILTVNAAAELDGSYRIAGGHGADSITGGAQFDILIGRNGADTLRGGGGNDLFRIDSITESNAAARDSILDFASGDRIDISRIDAIAGLAGDQAFTFIGNAAFGNQAGQLRFESTGGNSWLIQGDIDGNGIADFEVAVTVDDLHSITAADFIL